MNQEQVYQYVEEYLQAQECEIIDHHAAYLTAKLSVDADKDITNRPYYWMFVERTGAEAQTQTLTFVFDQEQVGEDINGELLQFGCWRLHQIFQSAQKNGKFIRLYEEVSASSSTQGLVPWLWLNYKISYVSDQKKDIFYPLGFNLISGQILSDFDSILKNYSLTPKIPDYHFTLRPIFSVKSAIQQIEVHIQEMLEGHDATWAKEANQRLDEESELIHAFFTADEEEKDNEETLKKRTEEIDRYRPRVEVNPINVGLIYLQSHPLSKIR